jgi:hypothetical protein
MNEEQDAPKKYEQWERRAFRHIYFEKISPYVSNTVILGSEYAMPDLLEYSFNSHNFRSNEFHDDTEIVTLGCSHTFGVGVPENLILPTFIKELTGVDDVINLATPGSSIAFQVRMLSIYIRYYGPPKIVLCNFPDITRYEYFTESGEVLEGSTFKGMSDNSYTNEQASIQSIRALGELEAICRAGNITLRWQTWVKISEYINYGFMKNFKHYINNPYNDENFQIRYSHLDPITNEICGDYYNNTCPDGCCSDLKNRSNGCFAYGYDRYSVPKRYQQHGLILEKEKLEKLKKTTFRIENNRPMGHFGSHAHWHWAKNLVGSL